MLAVSASKLFSHLEGYTNVYSVEDPGVFLVNADHPSKTLTLFDYKPSVSHGFAVGLHEIDDDLLKYQVWHVYYNSNQNFWFQMESDPSVKVGPSNLLLQATRGQQSKPLKSYMVNEKTFKIKSNGKCLEVSDTPSTQRDSYPLWFKDCRETTAQDFTLVSKMRGLCVLENEFCPESKKDWDVAGAIIVERLSRFSVKPTVMEDD